MSWVEKRQPSALDERAIQGLCYLDGAMVAYFYTALAGEGGVPFINPDWIKGQKLAQIEFPSGEMFSIRETNDPVAGGIVHIFGEIELPYFDTRDRAYAQIKPITAHIDYIAKPRGENQLELIGLDDDEHYLITYDNDQRRMLDVQKLEPVPFEDRRVPLLDEASKAKLPPLYANDGMGLKAVAQVKFFTPDSGWTWYATEYDGENIFFGLVIGFEAELGYFSLEELEELRGPLGLPIERDRYFTPTTLADLKAQHRREGEA